MALPSRNPDYTKTHSRSAPAAGKGSGPSSLPAQAPPLGQYLALPWGQLQIRKNRLPAGDVSFCHSCPRQLCWRVDPRETFTNSLVKYIYCRHPSVVQTGFSSVAHTFL